MPTADFSISALGFESIVVEMTYWGVDTGMSVNVVSSVQRGLVVLHTQSVAELTVVHFVENVLRGDDPTFDVLHGGRTCFVAAMTESVTERRRRGWRGRGRGGRTVVVMFSMFGYADLFDDAKIDMCAA